jgi:hypothetical protein
MQFLSSLRDSFRFAPTPRLSPWAVFFRRFVAAVPLLQPPALITTDLARDSRLRTSYSY